MGQTERLASQTLEKRWVAKLSNIAEILAFAGLIIANLVSIFSKVQDKPLTHAQAEKAQADAALSLGQGWKEYADQIKDDNEKLRQEMEAKAEACADEIAALKTEIANLKKQMNGNAKTSSASSVSS